MIIGSADHAPHVIIVLLEHFYQTGIQGRLCLILGTKIQTTSHLAVKLVISAGERDRSSLDKHEASCVVLTGYHVVYAEKSTKLDNLA